jgi:hypothetical protein
VETGASRKSLIGKRHNYALKLNRDLSGRLPLIQVGFALLTTCSVRAAARQLLRERSSWEPEKIRLSHFWSWQFPVVSGRPTPSSSAAIFATTIHSSLVTRRH